MPLILSETGREKGGKCVITTVNITALSSHLGSDEPGKAAALHNAAVAKDIHPVEGWQML